MERVWDSVVSPRIQLGQAIRRCGDDMGLTGRIYNKAGDQRCGDNMELTGSTFNIGQATRVFGDNLILPGRA